MVRAREGPFISSSKKNVTDIICGALLARTVDVRCQCDVMGMKHGEQSGSQSGALSE